MKLDDYRVRPDHPIHLADHPTADAGRFDGDKDAALAKTAELTTRLTELQNILWADHSHRVLVVLQAIDGGGKDGTIRHVFGPLNPQGVRVASFKAPTEPELAHDFLWRVHAEVPADGELVVFNRSHYEDVLVARVHALVPKDRWKARYRHIADFEQMLVDEGTTIVKFFLHISKEEQRRRLQARVDTPEKQWKFALGDLPERALWDDYQAAFEDMVNKTSTKVAPWFAIPADDKWYRDLVISRILVDTLEDLHLAYPAPADGVAGTVVD